MHVINILSTIKDQKNEYPTPIPSHFNRAKVSEVWRVPLTQNYSVLNPKVLQSFDKKAIANKNTQLIKKLLDFDKVIIAAQAKSHWVAWTIEDLLTDIKQIDINLAKKIHLLEDCTSPMVVPEIVDYTQQADAAFNISLALVGFVFVAPDFQSERVKKSEIFTLYRIIPNTDLDPWPPNLKRN